MSEQTMRVGVLAAYRDAVTALRDRWCEMHPGLAGEIMAVTGATLHNAEKLIGAPVPAAPEPDHVLVERIAQEYVADMASWPKARRDGLPPHIHDAVSKRVQELRSRPRVLDDITHGGADLALPPENDDTTPKETP